ncbi:MAG: hypothetical protein ACI82F_001140 [Planctomycetota bacterium]|jgi:hypothetical protein
MVRLKRSLCTFQLDLLVGLIAWAGVEIMAHPAHLVSLVDNAHLNSGLAFQIGVGVAFIAMALLAMRWTARLFRSGQKLSWDPVQRATQGTVMAEFALVLPVVLLLIGTVIQIALIAHAAVVVRYAAFAAARSAIVSFEADTNPSLSANPANSLLAALQVPPFPEWVDETRPEQAAYAVLATLSPRFAISDPQGANMARLVEAQGAHWQGGNYAQRMAYAREATRLWTIRSFHQDTNSNDLAAWHDSYAPLIPLPPHAVQPARQAANQAEIGYLLPRPPALGALIPNSIPIVINIPIPSPLNAVIPPISFTVNIPLPANLIRPLTTQLDSAINVLRTGSAAAVRAFAESPANIDPFAPKEVEITLAYDFKLAIPSLLQLAPGVTRPAPGGEGVAFRLIHEDYFTVRLQSTGGRRSLLSVIPKIPDVAGSIANQSFETVENSPLYFRPR